MSENGETAVEIPSVGAGAMNVETALQDVLKQALINDGISRGIREVVKALDRDQVRLCLLAESCDEKAYTKLVEALCKQNNINLIKVGDKKKLGEWAGLCKIDREGNPRKVVAASSVAVTKVDENSPAMQFLMDHYKN